MQVKQLELNLWEAIASASQSPDEANLPMVFNLLDLTLVELDTRSQLRVAGEAVGQITDLFCDRSNLCFEHLLAYASHGEPVMSDHAFDRYVRQSVVVDFEQFIQPLESLPRKSSEKIKDGDSIVGAVDKEVLLQVLEQEHLLSWEEELDLALSIAHAEDVSAWIEAISVCLKNNAAPMRLLDLRNSMKLPIVEIWLGLLLGDFILEQKGDFYAANEIWISDI
ncbi:MAG: hypothetical protein LH649_08645 [Pseudanabaena sp. CAN_BIN31]|nr:hypothetical protein [Pseudanabaena sp. CAN_BIN31]